MEIFPFSFITIPDRKMVKYQKMVEIDGHFHSENQKKRVATLAQKLYDEGAEKVFLSGSRARGYAKPNHDADLLAMYPEGHEKDTLYMPIQERTGMDDVDLITIPRAGGPKFVMQVLVGAILIKKPE